MSWTLYALIAGELGDVDSPMLVGADSGISHERSQRGGGCSCSCIAFGRLHVYAASGPVRPPNACMLSCALPACPQDQPLGEQVSVREFISSYFSYDYEFIG